MTRSHSAAVAVALCMVVAACSSGDDDAGLGEAQGTTTSTTEVNATTAVPPSTAAPVTTTTAPPTAAIGAAPTTPEEQAAVDAIDRWLELEDQAFAAGSTDAVIDELDALVQDGSVAVEGSLIVGGAVERTSRARIDRIWHPDEGVIGLDVCKTIETPAGEERTAHTITATAGATPFLQNETVYILGRDGITCPPDDIIEPVLATYERWMELLAEAVAEPSSPAGELKERSDDDLRQELTETLADLQGDLLIERLGWTPHAAVRSFDPSAFSAEAVACRRVRDGEGVFDSEGVFVFGEEAGHIDQLTVRAERIDDDWLVTDYFYAEDTTWCSDRLS